MKSPKPLKPRLLLCQTLIDKGCRLLPCGGNKNPLVPGWPSHPGFTIPELRRSPGIKAVGLRTGPEDGRILSIDIDGVTAVDKVCEYGLNPFGGTFIVGRAGDTHRLKLQFQLTAEQAAEIAPFQGKIHTKDPVNGAKGEAVEVFYSPGRQVIIGGRHPSGENYIWFDGCGPEALAAPNALWWEFIKGCYLRAAHGPVKPSGGPGKSSSIRSAGRNRHRPTGLIHVPSAAVTAAPVGQASGANTATPGCCFACLGSHFMHQQDSASVMSSTAGH